MKITECIFLRNNDKNKVSPHSTNYNNAIYNIAMTSPRGCSFALADGDLVRSFATPFEQNPLPLAKVKAMYTSYAECTPCAERMCTWMVFQCPSSGWPRRSCLWRPTSNSTQVSSSNPRNSSSSCNRRHPRRTSPTTSTPPPSRRFPSPPSPLSL